MSRTRLAWIQFRAQIGQLATAVVVIALGVALAAGMLLANAALRQSFEESVDALAGRAQLEVSPAAGGTLEEDILDKIRSVAGVEAAVPLLLGSAFLADGTGQRVSLVGIDMLDDATVRLYRATPGSGAQIEDPLIFLNQPDSVIVPSEFIRGRSLKLGDPVQLETPMGLRRLVIRGTVGDEGVGRAFGGELMIMDLFAAQRVMGSPGRVTRIDVVLQEGGGVEPLANRLRGLLPANLVVTSVAERKAELSRTVAGFQTLLDAISLMGLLLGALITANRLATVYQERMWEMGVLRGMGWTPGALVRDLLAEATLVSAFAVLVGLPLGILFAQFILGPVADIMALNFKKLQQIALPNVTPSLGSLTMAGTAGIASGALAALIPALRASRMTIATLKARRRRRDPWPEPRWKTLARGFVPLAAAGVVMLQAVTASGLLGAVAMVLIASSGGLLIQPLLRTISTPMGRLFGPAVEVGTRDQSRATSRAIGATGILMSGLALVVWIGNTGQSFENFVTRSLMAIRQGDLVVDSAFNETVGAVGENEPRLSEEILVELQGIPGIEAVGAEVSARSLAPETGIIAVDPIRFQRREFAAWELQGSTVPNALALVANGQAVLADENLVSQRHVSVGDVIRISTPTGPLERTIAGVIGPSFQSPLGDIVLSRELYRSYWRDPTITRVFVLLQPHANRSEITHLITERLRYRYRVRVSNSEDLADWFGESIRGAFAFLDAMSVLTIFVVLIGTADGLAANVIERTREIGTLRSLGYRPHSIAAMVLAQAFAIGVVGAVLAVVLGLSMSFVFVEGVLQSILGWQLKVYPTYAAAAGAAALGILACVLGGLVPAIRASRISVVRALRYE